VGRGIRRGCRDHDRLTRALPRLLAVPEFQYNGHRISYDDYGAGERPLILIHGLLMNRGMFDRLGREMAARGNRVIAIDLLGHGLSDRPADMTQYSMTFFARQIEALMDHLDMDEAVVGGTSLGANTTLELAYLEPKRVRAMMLEMPVLDNALLAVAVIFTPIMVGLRFGEPLWRAVASVARRIPRTNPLLDMGLDVIRQDPAPSMAVLEGLFLGSSAPHHQFRVEMTQPTLVIGHHRDPLHPFSDSGMLAEELPNARLIEASSILEWRISPERLDDELTRFLDDVWHAKPGHRPETALSGA
jgi:pimeloyl-ACP methyl ester carboxylesterase